MKYQSGKRNYQVVTTRRGETHRMSYGTMRAAELAVMRHINDGPIYDEIKIVNKETGETVVAYDLVGIQEGE